jgi:cerevisin
LSLFSPATVVVIMKAGALLSLAIGAAASPVFSTGSIPEAPLIQSVNAKHIPNSYIVKFKDHVQHGAAAAHHAWVNDLHVQTESRKLELRKRSSIPFVDEVFGGMKHTYNIAGSFLGYSGHFDDAVLEQLRRHPDVCRTFPLSAHPGTAITTSPSWVTQPPSCLPACPNNPPLSLVS